MQQPYCLYLITMFIQVKLHYIIYFNLIIYVAVPYAGTIIHSDEWAAYRTVPTLPNVASHSTVNHSVTFVSSSGTHTQNIESYWSRAKLKLKRMKGCHAHQLASYLDEFLWRERFGKTRRCAFNGIIGEIAGQYPV